MYKYYKRDKTHVIEVEPTNLKLSIQDKQAVRIKLHNFVTPGYITWDKDLTSPTKLKSRPISMLVSQGNIICNRQPHVNEHGIMYPAGTFIVYRDGTVAVKSLFDIRQEKNVWFAVGGCSILPNIRMKEEGFCLRKCQDGVVRDFSDIGRTCLRPIIGYNPITKKVIIAVRPESNIGRGRQTLINLGCTMGITLDGGGSTVLTVGGKSIFSTTRQLYSVITWM